MQHQLVLENRHTGERLELRRTAANRGQRLEMVGSIPPGRAAMSVHRHRSQDLRLNVRSGTLHAMVDDRRITVPAGESLTIPRGSAYRLWNEGRTPLTYDGLATPAGDLDRYFQAYFDVVNAGERDRPPLSYLARIHLRHQRTQAVRLLWGPAQTGLFAGAVVTGFLAGRFRGRDWPGSPERCPGLAEASAETRQPATV